MGFKLVVFLVLFSVSGILAQGTEEVLVIVKGSLVVAETNDNFVCATLDWWPAEKCNYNECPWGQSSILNLDLTHPFSCQSHPRYVVSHAFNPLRIRVGGSLQNRVIYGMDADSPCDPFSKMAGGLFGFSKGCLSMARWDELNLLFQKTGAIVTFGLNALHGRHHIRNGVWEGPWNSSNAREFVGYTISKGYPVDSWNLIPLNAPGNELSGHGVGASVSATLYGEDVIVLKTILDELYKDSHRQPLLVAPGGFFDQQWYAKLLEVSGSRVVNAVSHHVYNLGGGDDPHIANKIIDPKYLSRVADTYRDVQLTIEKYGPWASPWVSEAGGAYNSGSRQVSNKFLDSFWYLDQLGLSSKYKTKAYCRQSLIGGNYGLLDTDSFVPNPDYYSALLWHRLMGKGVLSIDISGSTYLRAYAHCRKQKSGISLLLINLNKSTEFHVSVRNDINVDVVEKGGITKDGSFVTSIKRSVAWIGKVASDGSEMREEYHLTAQDGNHLSRTMLLNGSPVQLTEDGDIPALDPVSVPVDSPISIAPFPLHSWSSQTLKPEVVYDGVLHVNT